ncbi:MAG TPA: hypothetical protein GXZ81_05950 [Fastidiosipila sp.]|jgi:Ca2+/Na+ antiporter|nr:hypothetical protein [Fastidiosipila sp.]
MNTRLMRKVQKSILLFEVIIAIIIAVAVLLSIPDLFQYIYNIVAESKEMSYEIFGDFLRHVLILVVGLEMIVMILTRSHKSILTLVLFVIARKMLVYADSMVDIFVGALAIAVIFVVLRYLVGNEKFRATYGNIFSAAIPVKKVRREFGFKLPEDNTNTLGDFIYELSKDNNLQIKEGLILEYNDYEFTIVTYKDGIIERILIEEKTN